MSEVIERGLFKDKAFYRKLWRLMLPIALQSLMLSAVAACDAIMLGRVEQNSMAAVSLATQIQFVQNIIISSVTTKFRDLQMLVEFGLRLWEYGAPIAYGLRLVPEKWMRLYLLNPMAPIVTTFRYAAFGFGYFDLSSYLVGWAVSLALFFLGLMLFSRVERTFMDTI